MWSCLPDATDRAKEAMIGAMGPDSETHVLIVSVEAGGCSDTWDMQIIERLMIRLCSKVFNLVTLHYLSTTRTKHSSMVSY